MKLKMYFTENYSDVEICFKFFQSDDWIQKKQPFLAVVEPLQTGDIACGESIWNPLKELDLIEDCHRHALMTQLKLEPYSGISGDMFLGALAPLLNAEADITALPARLGLDKVTVAFEDVIRSTIRCRKASVRVDGHAPEAHGHGHPHTHDHGHAHRAYRDIVHLIQHADLPDSVKALALAMFRDLGEAEADMHGIPLEEVHFHEVGGEDAIVDIVGAALLIDKLSPDAVYSTPVCVGSGFVKTANLPGYSQHRKGL